jgi:Zn-dependent protease
MNFDLTNLIQGIALGAIPVVFAITLHEAAHGYVARHFGDYTAHNAGRISLNPLKHIDPVGTILVPLVILISSAFVGAGGILFGWAKPVPVNFGQLRHPKRDMLWVAAAGPGANLVMACIWALMFKFAQVAPDNYYSGPLAGMARVGITANIWLMVLNLLPLPPLDGGRIAVSILPGRLAWRFAMIEPYGFIILLVLLFTGVLRTILSPFAAIVFTGIITAFNLR